MKIQTKLTLASVAIAFILASFGPAMALTMSECSAKYKAAQKAGTLKGMKWNDFRKAQCGTEVKPTAAKSAPAKSMKATKAVFPSKIDPKYSKESAGKARQKTCVDQYNANKAKNANGGMKWIEKGGGYWGECNKHLKG